MTSRRGFFGLLFGAVVAPIVEPLAAVLPGPVKTALYSAIGIREELSDVIYKITPTETHFISLINKRARARFSDWQKDKLGPAP